MSVLPIMEDVLVPVLTLLVATTVLVPLVVHWALTVMPVMVSSVMVIIMMLQCILIFRQR